MRTSGMMINFVGLEGGSAGNAEFMASKYFLEFLSRVVHQSIILNKDTASLAFFEKRLDLLQEEEYFLP